jgi:hypothetical protein
MAFSVVPDSAFLGWDDPSARPSFSLNCFSYNWFKIIVLKKLTFPLGQVCFNEFFTSPLARPRGHQWFGSFIK